MTYEQANSLSSTLRGDKNDYGYWLGSLSTIATCGL